MPARPYICRFSILSRLSCPSTGPLLHGSLTAASTALRSCFKVRTKRTTPATQMQPEDHLRALDRKVFQRAPVPAMARVRDGLATRADGRVLTVSFHDPTLIRLEYAAKCYVAQIGEEVT
jgi:hypothetical protein